MTGQNKFNAWLDGLLKNEHKTDKFRAVAWREAQEMDALGLSFELAGYYTVRGKPSRYRPS